MAKRMVNEAEEVNKLTEYVRQEGNKTIIGGNLEVDGNLSVNGSTPGGLHVYKCRYKTTDTSVEFDFLWFTTLNGATQSQITNELNYKLSSGSGFGFSIPVVMNNIGYYNAVLAYDGGLKLYENGTTSHDITSENLYQIY